MAPSEDKHFAVGQRFSEVIAYSAQLLDRFAEFSGDVNPIHCDAQVAQSYGFSRRVAHGAILVSVLSRLIGMRIPGAGAVWQAQTIDWKRPVFEGDTVTLTATIEAYSEAARTLRLVIVATNQHEEEVMQGHGIVRVAQSLASNEAAVEEPAIALVTGGSRGIGAEVARQLGRAGLTVVVNYHSEEARAESVVAEVRAAGGKARSLRANIARVDEAEGLVAAVLREFGRLDVVVHGASPALTNRPVEEIGYTDLEPFLATYLGGALALVRAAVPSMKAHKFGRLVFLGTVALHGTAPSGMGAYLTAKHGLWGLVRSLASELGAFGITANMVSPEMTVTDLTNHVPLRVKEVQARRNPMRRLPTPFDTAASIAFLSSREAGYINGQELLIAGGPT